MAIQLRDIDWTDVANVVPATGTDYHEQIEYHPGTGEILYTGGNGSLDHWRLTWTGSAVSVTKQSNTAFGFGITSRLSVRRRSGREHVEVHLPPDARGDERPAPAARAAELLA